MSRRILLIIIAFIVLIGGSIAVVLLVRQSPILQNTVLKIANVSVNTNTVANVNRSASNTNATAEADRTQITFVSRTLAERFGSDSNQNGGSNLVEAQAYATKSLADFLQTQITQRRQTSTTVTYHGFVTKVLVIKLTKLTSSSATSVVTTQRQETTGGDTKSYNQDIQIDLVKTGSTWQVNAANWLLR